MIDNYPYLLLGVALILCGWIAYCFFPMDFLIGDLILSNLAGSVFVTSALDTEQIYYALL